jgi:hypothetical protein
VINDSREEVKHGMVSYTLQKYCFQAAEPSYGTWQNVQISAFYTKKCLKMVNFGGF